jgi:hypothetical protein
MSSSNMPSPSIGVETYPYYVKPEDVAPCPRCGTMPSLMPVMYLSYNMKCPNSDCPTGYPDAEFLKSSDAVIERWNQWAIGVK